METASYKTGKRKELQIPCSSLSMGSRQSSMCSAPAGSSTQTVGFPAPQLKRQLNAFPVGGLRNPESLIRARPARSSSPVLWETESSRWDVLTERASTLQQCFVKHFATSFAKKCLCSSRSDQAKQLLTTGKDWYILIGLENRIVAQWKASVYAVQLGEDNSGGQLWGEGNGNETKLLEESCWQRNRIFFRETAKGC